MTAIPEHIKTLVKRRLGKTVRHAEQIYSGNSRVLKLRCNGNACFIAKLYPRSKDDPRDRLGVEFGALAFLWNHGIRCIPQPLYADRKAQIALYEFIPGARIAPEEVTEQEIAAGVEFLRALAGLRREPESASLPPASDACFTYGSYLENARKRLARFERLSGRTPLHRAAAAFLNDDFKPLFNKAEAWYCRILSEVGHAPDRELSPEQKTLSPSDFGFHNAIRRPDGSLAFVDFEYFGWDDPAQMIADFIHYPAVPVSTMLKENFLDRALGIFGQDDTLEFRVRLVYPIMGLTWCLILLNEFLPGPLARRRAANGARPVKEILYTQLLKARNKLDEIRTCFDLPATRAPWKFA